VSRYTKAAPGGRPIILDDGYHLCARCGAVLCTDDGVVVVYRAPQWGIYVHPEGPNCPAKAVSGWRAAELALDMRETNIPTPREAYHIRIGGFILPFVSLLDNEHCNAEMAAVTISRKEFLPSESTFLEGNSNDDDFLFNVVEKRSGPRDSEMWQYWEVGLVARGRLAEITRDVLREERMSLHVKRNDSWSGVTLSEKDQRPMRTISYLSGIGITRLYFPARGKADTQQRKSRSHKLPSRGTLSDASTRDAIGKSGEFALYSKQRLTDGRRLLSFRGLALDEFNFYRLSGPKPRPTSLPFDSMRCPEMFDWSYDGVPNRPVEHWRGNPKTYPYGPVARLKPAFLAALRNLK
jgi:hypothetical protein